MERADNSCHLSWLCKKKKTKKGYICKKLSHAYQKEINIHVTKLTGKVFG
jgi:hypothetical protein